MEHKSWVRRAIAKIGPSGEAVAVYRTMGEAAEANFMSKTSVWRRCAGRAKKPFAATGYSFRYADEESIEEKTPSNVEKVDPASGKVVGTYRSLYEASKKTGLSRSTIVYHCDGKAKSRVAKDGYIYRWMDEERKNRDKKTRARRGRKVAKFDSSGRKVATYGTIREAAEANHKYPTDISKRCRKQYQSFVGRDGYGYRYLD